MIGGDERLGAVERPDVYAKMHCFRLLEVLREDYPKLVAVVGDAEFHNLVTEYLIAHPPEHASIAHAGIALPDFLTGHSLEARRHAPWLHELARLERRRV